MTAVKDIRSGKWRFYGVGNRKAFAKFWGIKFMIRTMAGIVMALGLVVPAVAGDYDYETPSDRYYKQVREDAAQQELERHHREVETQLEAIQAQMMGREF